MATQHLEGFPEPEASPRQVCTRDVDERVVLYNVSFEAYSAIRDLLDGPGVKLTYLEGALEIMSPSLLHEDVKSRIARLLELWALERDVPLYAYGSTTFRSAPKERGLEPDECYVVGRTMIEGSFPDLAIEVAVTRGGIPKLAVYRGLGVREVWIWDEGVIHVYVLGEAGYEERAASSVIPGIDLAPLARFAGEADQHAALVAFRAELRGK
jgi:Uma2 family endonuclease